MESGIKIITCGRCKIHAPAGTEHLFEIVRVAITGKKPKPVWRCVDQVHCRIRKALLLAHAPMFDVTTIPDTF